MEDAKPLVWVRKSWEQLKQIRVIPHFFKAPPRVAHPGAVHGDKIGVLHQRKHAVKQGHLPTNHERVIIWRAARMHISTAEYKRRFCA